MAIDSYKTQILNLNNTYNSSGQNNILNIKFGSSLNLNDYQVALANLQCYYSWNNITAAKGNNQLTYFWPLPSPGNPTGSMHLITFPDGMYTVSDISGFISNRMVLNNHYLLDADGAVVSFIELAPNRIYQRITLTITPIPTALPSGWTNPASIVFPATAATPQLIVPNTNIQTTLGFATNTYPNTSQPTIYSENSQNIPQITDIFCVNVNCNVIGGSFFNSSPNTIFTFSPTVGFSEFISVEPKSLIWYDCLDANFNNIQIRLTDQLNRDLLMLDPTFIVCLYLRKKN